MRCFRIEYNNVTSDWYADTDSGWNELRYELFTHTSFSCYNAMKIEFGTDGNENEGLGRFLAWLDDDTYDQLCKSFFDTIIKERLLDDGEYLGITIEEADAEEVNDEMIEESIARGEVRFNQFMSDQE